MILDRYEYMSNQSYTDRKSSVENKETLPTGMTPEFLDQVAERFRILGEPMRLRLLHILLAGEKSVGELVELSESTQANVSRHLQTLSRSGILSRRKEGLHVFYAIADRSVFELCDHVCGSLQRHLEKKASELPT